jgi:LPS sulfotransferase NodH
VTEELRPASPRKIYDLATRGHDYPTWDGPPRRTIILCSYPRSGSTLLGEALYFAGGLGCPLEYFHSGFRPGFEKIWNAESMSDLVRETWGRRTDPSGTLSVKLFWRDVVDLAASLDPAAFAGLVEMQPEETPTALYRDLAALLRSLFPQPAFIHLYRRDRLRRAISSVAASQTGQWRAIPGLENAPLAERAFDYDRIDGMISSADFSQRHWCNLFAATAVSPVTITYEDLVADYQSVVAALLAQLGGGQAIRQPRMRRQADAVNENWVLRYLRENVARRATRPQGSI